MTSNSGRRPRFWRLLSPLFLALTASLAPELSQATTNITQIAPQTIRPETISGLQAMFQTLDYDWMKFEEGVPIFILEGLPVDMHKSVTIAEKKQAFFMGLLPMVLLANQEIKEEREELLQIIERHRARNAEDGDYERIKEISKKYGLRGRPLIDHRVREQLLKRVDTIPPSLVLAQAANESAWGTSRFARLGNNLFGEWTFKPGTGIVPVGRPPGEIYEVRKFPSIYASIRSYMRNLNSHSAYRTLREIRMELRKEEKPITGLALAIGLSKYSQRGQDYIREIKSMIRQNKLTKLNSVDLRQPKTESFTSIRTSGNGFFSTRNKLIGHHATARLDP